MADACGVTTSVNGGPSVCAVPVYPREVTASLRQEMKTVNLDDNDRRQQALQRLQLPDTMTLSSSGYKTMKDAAMIELQFTEADPAISKSSTTATNAVTTTSTTSPEDGPPPQLLRFVQEVDVVRGREMIKHNTGDVGSICLVVRRPG